MPTRARPLTPAERCGWCSRTFQAKTVGSHRKKFCSATCKNDFDSALRWWGRQEIALGRLSATDVRAAYSRARREEGVRGEDASITPPSQFRAPEG